MKFVAFLLSVVALSQLNAQLVRVDFTGIFRNTADAALGFGVGDTIEGYFIYDSDPLQPDLNGSPEFGEYNNALQTLHFTATSLPENGNKSVTITASLGDLEINSFNSGFGSQFEAFGFVPNDDIPNPLWQSANSSGITGELRGVGLRLVDKLPEGGGSNGNQGDMIFATDGLPQAPFPLNNWDLDTTDTLINFSRKPDPEVNATVGTSFEITSLSGGYVVPEPGTYGLLLVMALCIYSWRRRR